MKHFALDQHNNRIPVVRMFTQFGRLTDEAALAAEMEVRLPNGAVVDFHVETENVVYVLQ